MKTIYYLLMVFVCIASAKAQLLTFEFTGAVIDFYGMNNPAGFSVSQPVSGWFSYDSAGIGTEDHSLGVSNRYNYYQIASVEVQVGSKLISLLNGSTRIDVDNDQWDSRALRYEDHFFYRFEKYVPSLGTNPVQCIIKFMDYTASVYDSYQLPTSFDLSAFDAAQFYFFQNINGYQVTCSIDEITLVPEPATLLLAGLGTLFLRRRLQA